MRRPANSQRRRTFISIRQKPLLEAWRHASLFIKTVASLVLVAFLSLTLQPLAIAANLPASTPPTQQVQSNEEKLAQALEAVEARLDKFEQKLGRKEDAGKEKDELKTLRRDLDSLDAQALADFDRIGKHLQDKNLPPVILKRHQDAVAAYRQEMATLKANLDDMDQAKDDEERKGKAQKARDHLKTKHKKRGPKTKFDPNDLPNKSLQPNRKNVPKLTKGEFTRAGLYSNPTVKLAALGDFKFDKLPGASDPAYLAPTTEVVITDHIKAKAAELQHDPVKIYQWVRNNVEWLPIWGATQDADVTLGSMRGNAFDIASLLIALYRASGIPARYVHGAIEVPEAKFRNWAGGFTNADAAGNFASSGGIPVTSVVSGGRVTKLRLEHIWVEAAIDFHPSRGGINKSADSWVQLDPSFKQYEDLPGLDLVAVSGLDPAGLVQSFTASGVVNQQEGWASGFNSTIIQNAEIQARTALHTHIQNNFTNPTMGDVIGGRKIVSETGSVLPPGLPYRSIVVGARYGTLPSAQQHTMTFAFGIDFLGEPINPVTLPWPRLNNHKVTLSFRPASPADEATLASLVPAGITDPNQMPSSIPSYLILVIPEIKVDGQVVGQGTAMRLGETLNFHYGINRVNGHGSHSYVYDVTAGSYLSVAVAGGSVSKNVLQGLRTKLLDTESKIKSGDPSVIAALTREDILGDMFQAGSLGYFGQFLAFSHLQGQPQKARHDLPFAYGTVGYEPNVQTLFGLPRAIKPGGVVVNVRLSWNVQPLNGDMSRWRDLNLQAGFLSSALEHIVPEQIFGTPTQPVQGVSAVKALQIAINQGQRVYHITQANQAQVLPNLHLDGLAMSEIQQALAVGKEVIAHTDRVSVPGWTGEGYILFDPVSGAGAYKITGGANGGFILAALGALLIFLGIFLIPIVAGLAPFILISAGLHAFVIGVLNNISVFSWDSVIQGLSLFVEILAFAAFAGLITLTLPAAIFLAVLGLILAVIQFIQWLQTQSSLEPARIRYQLAQLTRGMCYG